MKKEYLKIMFQMTYFNSDIILSSSPLDEKENFGDLGDFVLQ